MKPFPLHNVEPTLAAHLQLVLDGEYDIPGVDFKPYPSIIDLGGNQGSFAYWAQARYPGARVRSYEPNPTNCALFRKNLAEAEADTNVVLEQAAVFPTTAPTLTFYNSSINAGMHSLAETMAGANATSITVPVIHPQDLPECDILKADIEGVEYDVISSYLQTHKYLPTIIAFEYHNDMIRRSLDGLLADNYYLHRAVVTIPSIGVLMYLRRDIAHQRYGDSVPA